MKLIITFIISLIISIPGHAPIATFKVKGKLLAVDYLGNIFTGEKDVIVKYSKTGKLLNNYSSKLLGNVSSIDVSNPLRYLAYYNDIGRVVFLDNTLSVHNEIALQDHGYDQTTLACSSNNDAFWVYDAINFQLVKLNDQVKTVQNTGNLIQLLGLQINPNYVTESNDKVYLNDPDHGIFVFDIYANYVKKVPLKNLTSFDVIGNKLVYFSSNYLYSFNLNTLASDSVDLNIYAPKIAIPYNNQIYLQSDSIKILNL